jgi:3-(3-hydroxy-phenyl)propionate hydroxylase
VSAAPTLGDPIAIVGLGPTGAVLAALLADLGCAVEVIEREPTVVERPRAVFLDDEVMRVLQRLDCAEALRPLLRPVQGMDLVDVEGRVLFRYRPAAPEGPLGWAEGYMFHQPDLERVLRAALAQRSAVRLHAGTDVHALETRDAGATLHLRDADGTSRTLTASFVVGCDGARSTVRRHMNTTLDVLGADARWLVVDLEDVADPALPPFTMQYCDPARPSTYVPLSGGRARFELMALEGETDAQLTDSATVQQLLTPWIAADRYRIARAVVYTFHALLARGWRHGPLLLAGDAAHQMPPFLGQGMGCGIRDAADLAWKLAAVWHGRAATALLDTYEAERGPATQLVIATDLKLGAMIQTTDRTIAARRDADALARGGALPLTPSRFPIGPALCETTAGGGLPFPQCRDEHGVGSDTLLGAGFALVGALEISDAARATLDALGTTRIAAPPAPIAAWLREQGATAALVRPDRLILAVVSNAEALDRAIAPLAECVTTTAVSP